MNGGASQLVVLRAVRLLGFADVDGWSLTERGRDENILDRYRGYDTRFTSALRRALAGEHRWVDGTDVDSCHRVWFELHEDLIATLGTDRLAEP